MNQSSRHHPHTVKQQDSFRDDSLEYFIKFPSPDDQQQANTTDEDYGPASNSKNNEDYVFVYDGENVPIVMLLGWAGCKEKYLKKYSKIYEDRGLITVRYIAPVEFLFWRRKAMKTLGEKVLKLIFDMNFESHPLIFHLFSNGGAFTYQHIIMAMKKQNRSLKIKGTIFDSAPGERRFSGLFRAISAIYGREKPLNCFASFLISITLVFIWLIEDTYQMVSQVLCRGEEQVVCVSPVEGLKDEAADWPQMFLYSKEDDIIPHIDVENFARYRQEKRGVDVHAICFEKSEHVKHYIYHPKEYIQSVCRFITECLSYQPGGRQPRTKAD